MFRRCVVTLVLFGFLAGQLATVPHTHGGQSPAEQQEHAIRPHFHVGLHSHAHGGHSPDHGDGHSHGSVPLQPVGPVGSEHDDDCVYLPYALVAAKEVRVAVDAGQFGQAVASCHDVADPSDPMVLSLPQQTALHGCGGEHCALYLTLRTLRI